MSRPRTTRTVPRMLWCPGPRVHLAPLAGGGRVPTAPAAQLSAFRWPRVLPACPRALRLQQPVPHDGPVTCLAHKSLVAEAGPLGVCLRRAGTPGPERGGDSGSGEKPAASSEKVAGRCDHLPVGPRVVQARGRAPFTRRAPRGPAAGRLRQSWITCWPLSSGCPQALWVKMSGSALGSSQRGGFSLLAPGSPPLLPPGLQGDEAALELLRRPVFRRPAPPAQAPGSRLLAGEQAWPPFAML